jgi:hypothetical protein
MYFDYIKLPTDQAQILRQKFIDTYIDTSHKLYQKNIKDLTPDTLYHDGMIVSHLWSCLKRETRYSVDFETALHYLYQLSNDSFYVMRDIQPKRSKEWLSSYSSFHPKSDSYLQSDDIIHISPRELCEVILHDHLIEVYRIGYPILDEDLYVFDDSLNWYIVFTHEECNGKPLCYSSLSDSRMQSERLK